MYVRAGRPAFAWPYAGVHRNTNQNQNWILPRISNSPTLFSLFWMMVRILRLLLILLPQLKKKKINICPVILIHENWFATITDMIYSFLLHSRLRDCRIHRLVLCRCVRPKQRVDQSAWAVEYTDCASAEEYGTPFQWMSLIWHWTLLEWGSCNAGAFGNAGYHFITIAPRSILTRSGYTWNGPIYGSSRTAWNLNWMQITYAQLKFLKM